MFQTTEASLEGKLFKLRVLPAERLSFPPPRSMPKHNSLAHLYTLNTRLPMRLTVRQRAIMHGIANDLAHFRRLGRRKYIPNWMDRSRAAEAADGLVRTAPGEWLQQRLTPSDYVAISRDVQRLEASGLIERHALGMNKRQTTHLSLTTAGRKLLAELKAQESAADG
jgi:hypothetical protein